MRTVDSFKCEKLDQDAVRLRRSKKAGSKQWVDKNVVFLRRRRRFSFFEVGPKTDDNRDDEIVVSHFLTLHPKRVDSKCDDDDDVGHATTGTTCCRRRRQRRRFPNRRWRVLAYSPSAM